MSRAAASAALLLLASGSAGWTGCALEVPTADWQLPTERLAPLEIESVLEPSAPPQAGPRLRVVTFNVEFGEDLEALATLFSSPPFDAADLFLLQEIEDHDAEPSSRASRLAAATGMAFVYLPAKTIRGGTQGVAILSRRRLANVRFMNLPFFRTSIRGDHRVALAAEVDGIDVVNLHLFLQLGIAERILQLGPATQELAPVALIGGDFNTNPYAWSDMLPVVVTDPITNVEVARIVDDAMGEFGFDAATRDSGATHHAPGTRLRLDFDLHPRARVRRAAGRARGLALRPLAAVGRHRALSGAATAQSWPAPLRLAPLLAAALPGSRGAIKSSARRWPFSASGLLDGACK